MRPAFVTVVLCSIGLVWAPRVGEAGTVTRSCKGGWLLEYSKEGSGKTLTLTGPLVSTATGTSKGTVPSATKARERACKSAARKAHAAFSISSAMSEVCKVEKHGFFYLRTVGGIAKSKGETQRHRVDQRMKRFECRTGKTYERAVCGDGRVAAPEECDDGQRNSDNNPNACRTNCTRARCGDGVVDRGEACDEGSGNHDLIPGECRRDCKRARCGDGVVDPMLDEVCDDGNSDQHDGCHECQRCWAPKSGDTIERDTVLCEGSYALRDTSGKGALRITGNDVTLDCRGAELRGSGQRGIGILATGQRVTLLNCRVSGYAVGVDLRGAQGAVLDSQMCSNKTDAKTSSPVIAGRNACAKSSSKWREQGRAGCARPCP